MKPKAKSEALRAESKIICSPKSGQKTKLLFSFVEKGTYPLMLNEIEERFRGCYFGLLNV
jgi:hypothetical protein